MYLSTFNFFMCKKLVHLTPPSYWLDLVHSYMHLIHSSTTSSIFSNYLQPHETATNSYHQNNYKGWQYLGSKSYTSYMILPRQSTLMLTITFSKFMITNATAPTAVTKPATLEHHHVQQLQNWMKWRRRCPEFGEKQLLMTHCFPMTHNKASQLS